MEQSQPNALANLARRLTWDEYAIGIAQAVSRRSDCIREQVGAVVLGVDKRVRSTGYNGAPAGMEGCSTCPRAASDVAPGSCYANCVAVHAEANALLYCDRRDLPGSTMYIYPRKPCYGCLKLIAGAGIQRIVWVDSSGIMSSIGQPWEGT